MSTHGTCRSCVYWTGPYAPYETARKIDVRRCASLDRPQEWQRLLWPYMPADATCEHFAAETDGGGA